MYARQSVGHPHESEGYPITSSDLDRLSGKTYLLMPHPPPTSSLTSQQHNYHPLSPHSGSPYTSSSVKRDPSPTRSNTTVLSDISVNAPYGGISSTAGPISPQAFSSPTYTYQAPPSHSHIPSPYTQTQTSQHHSSSPSHYLHSPSHPHLPPPPHSHSHHINAPQPQPHPTILQDIRDFTMRSIPATSSITHYFDFSPEDSESLDNSIITTPGPGSHPNRGHSLPSNPTSSATTSSSSRQQQHQPSQQQRRQSMPNYHTYNDFGLYPTSLETSFHIDYAPHQPRSPFSAVSFSTSTTDSSFQELAQQLGF
jgi:hypothetical protein